MDPQSEPIRSAKVRVVGKEGLFEGKSTVRASKKADSGDESLERRGVDLQGHSDAQWSESVSDMTSVGEVGVISSSKSGYEWVSDTMWKIPTKFADAEGVRRLGSPSAWVRKGSKVNIEFLPCLPSERVCHRGPNGDWFFIYTCVLAEIGVRFPFTRFECAVLRQINCAPSQIHHNSWAYMRAFQILMEYLGESPALEVFFFLFQAKSVDRGVWVTLNSHQGRSVFCPFKPTYRDFKEFYIKVRSVEDSFPFFLDEHLAERFPLYWNKRPVQCLRVEELSDRDADLVEFLFLNLKGGKVLNTSEVLKWDSDKESVVGYFESKIPDCNTSSLKSFFKQRAEKEVSSSQVVKIEKGNEVNKPAERKRPVSLKRLRSEEAFGKKVIDLTDAKCCGREVSLKDVADFTRSQEALHGFNGTEDLSSLWCEHYPFSIIADEHFRSKADLESLGKVGKVAAARYMQVEAARLLCISRELEIQAVEEESSQHEKKADLVELEKSLKLARDQVVLKEKENGLLIEENSKLKTKVSQLTKDKSELENKVVELCGEKKEAEVSKKAHGFEMFAAAWDRAKAQVELFVPGVNLEKMDPVKVVYKGQLVDDDQVSADGSDDHNPQ
ncbi:hypothetical protein PIB30_011225 [Stylosanthes scabra]|uniref:Transposase (putative) gypsy type domain-containing protein n=1 Tax=Stylosanthes scabra TaxID=79078 RepID=A0ABU6T631_9FABA|nr:hypothetical protein [Stylosanthes scabra]